MKNMEIEHLWNILLEGAPYMKKIGKLMHNICDERFLNLTACFGFFAPKAPKRTRNE